MVDWVKAAWSISSSRACRLSGLARSGYYRKPQGNPLNEVLSKRIREISAVRVRFGFQRIHTLLRREGWKVNRKRVLRSYRLEGLQLKVASLTPIFRQIEATASPPSTCFKA